MTGKVEHEVGGCSVSEFVRFNSGTTISALTDADD